MKCLNCGATSNIVAGGQLGEDPAVRCGECGAEWIASDTTGLGGNQQ